MEIRPWLTPFLVRVCADHSQLQNIQVQAVEVSYELRDVDPRLKIDAARDGVADVRNALLPPPPAILSPWIHFTRLNQIKP